MAQLSATNKDSGLKTLSSIFSIDVGSEISGVCVLSYNKILYSGNIPNSGIIDKVRNYSQNGKLLPIVEDIRPYSGKLSPETIQTCKFIGELCYRLKTELKIDYRLYPRSAVRKWVFDAFPDCKEAIDKKIAYLDEYGRKRNEALVLEGKKPKYRRYRVKTGELRKASFHYVDDRVIINAMKRLWEIPEPKPFKSNIYGLKDDSWQALALGSYYLYGLPTT